MWSVLPDHGAEEPPYSPLNSAYQISIKRLSLSLSAAARRAHIVGSNYLWLFICLTASRRGALKKSRSQEQLTEAPAGTHLWLPGCDLNHDVIGHRLALRCLWAWRPGRRRRRGVGGFVCAAVLCSGINEGLEALWNGLCKHSRGKKWHCAGK